MTAITDDELVAAAWAARERALCDYSNFAVGAAFEDESGEIWTGANVENASYGLCLCAERVAIAAAVTNGQSRFRAIVVATEGPRPAAPCGMCRQVMVEFPPSFEVRCISATSDARIETDVASLLPYAFDGGYLADDD